MNLISRIGIEYPLVPTDNPNRYIADFSKSNYMRTGYRDENDSIIAFVDPEGGPLVAVGDEIEGRTIKSILQENGKTIFEFDE